MTGSAIAMMIVICALVWGGFLGFLTVVWRIEKRKSRLPGTDDAHDSSPSTFR